MAVANLLLAARYGLDSIVRFDDLAPDADGETTAQGAVAKAFEWLRLPIGESPWRPGVRGPYLQSERLLFYREAALALAAQDLLYACQCRGTGRPRSCTCDHNARAEGEELYAGSALRLRTLATDVIVKDLARGPVRIPRTALGNPVILKSSGIPSYYLACAVDDAHMGVQLAVFERGPISTAYVQTISQALFGTSPTSLHIGRIHASGGRDLKSVPLGGGSAAYLDSYQEAGVHPLAVRGLLVRSLLKGGSEHRSLNPDLASAALGLSPEEIRLQEAAFPIEELPSIEKAVNSIPDAQRLRPPERGARWNES